MAHAACWAHARRKFFDAAKLDPGDVVAVRMVAWIDELFGIDAEARERKLDHAGRHALRLDATPLLATISEEIETVRTSALPSSALGRAAKYSLTSEKKSLDISSRSRKTITGGTRIW
jgi:hypothetical protein